MIGMAFALLSRPFSFDGRARRGKGSDTLDGGFSVDTFSYLCRHLQFASLFFYSLSFLLAPSALSAEIRGDDVHACDVFFWGSHCVVSMFAVWSQERRLRRNLTDVHGRPFPVPSFLARLELLFALPAMSKLK